MKLLGLTVWQWDLITLVLAVAGAYCAARVFHGTRNDGKTYNLYRDLQEWLEARKARKGA